MTPFPDLRGLSHFTLNNWFMWFTMVLGPALMPSCIADDAIGIIMANHPQKLGNHNNFSSNEGFALCTNKYGNFKIVHGLVAQIKEDNRWICPNRKQILADLVIWIICKYLVVNFQQVVSLFLMFTMSVNTPQFYQFILWIIERRDYCWKRTGPMPMTPVLWDMDMEHW